MYLKTLSIQGFKSFAKKSELSFDAPITAIVGPNGSGKSNVAEAFRFVLGEQSVKSMRGKKGEDLIWGGSEAVARGNRASVTVVLNNETRIFPLDFDDVTVERVVHRDGQNEYRLNGSSVRLRDVQEVLSAANIGPSGHHIISQGEADRILSASPKERREMIEDALGLKTYQYKKQEAEKKLVKTEENMAQVESLRREHAPHLRYLEKQIQRIEKSLKVQEELKATYAEYLKREDTYIAHHYDRLNSERLEPVSRLKVVKDELEQARAASATEEVSQFDTAISDARTKLRDARAAKESCVREISQLEGQIELLKRQVSQVEEDGGTEGMVSRAELAKLIASIEQDVEKAVAREDVSYFRRTLTDVVHRLQTFLRKGASAKTGVVDEKELKELVLRHEKLTSELEEKRLVEDKIQTELTECEEKRQSEQTAKHEAERAVFEYMNEERELENRVRDIDRELAVLERDRNEFKRELQEAVTLIGSATARYFEYEIRDGEREVTIEEIISESREAQRDRRRTLEKLKIRLEELGVGSTEAVMKEYEEAKERDEFLAKELSDLTASIEKLRQLIDELTGQLNEQFGEGIEKISIEFNKFFILMFGGGSATLERKLEKTADADDEGTENVRKEEGIELSVKLPNKRVRGLDMLSGGERALSSIALIFAMSQVNPPLFIILDETDAALDEANSRRYGDMIEALSEKSQLILITHNRETMGRASVLYGVTMGAEGVSKLLSVKFDEALAVAK